MSHYAVTVFHRKDQDIEDLLAPYSEHIEVEPYIWKTRSEAIEYARKNYESAKDKTDEECWEMMAEGSETDAEGNIYSTYNPDSKWDWWVVGGRFCGMLRQNGQEVDSGRVGDIEFPFDEDVYKDALRFWDVVVDHQSQEDGEDFFSLYKEEYYKEYYHDRETYAKRMAQFNTYAVVTPDGEWHAPGEMGWFACSTENADESNDWYNNFQERFIDSADPDWIVEIVDCHI